MNSKQRIKVYVDGFNFYYGLKEKKWKKYYWLDLVTFFESFIRPHQELINVNYFSARPRHEGKADRQDLFFSANMLNPRFTLTLGKYLPKDKTCKNCGNKHRTYEEKETDVKIACSMIADVVSDTCDISILVSADSDLIPPIQFIKEFKPSHKVFVYFPPNRFSSNLKTLANSTTNLIGSEKYFSSSLLPNEVKTASGYIIRRPESWC